jgi:TatA/E family protein of Tat protein translocase
LSCGDCRVSFRGSMMKPVSFSETIFLFFLALVIFGPKKLPEIARQVGKMLNEFRRASNEFKSQIEQEISHIEVENRKPTVLPPSPAPAGTASRSLSGELPATLAASAESQVPAAAAADAIASEAVPVSDVAASDTATPVVVQQIEPEARHEAQTEVLPEPAQESHA